MGRAGAWDLIPREHPPVFVRGASFLPQVPTVVFKVRYYEETNHSLSLLRHSTACSILIPALIRNPERWEISSNQYSSFHRTWFDCRAGYRQGLADPQIGIGQNIVYGGKSLIGKKGKRKKEQYEASSHSPSWVGCSSYNNPFPPSNQFFFPFIFLHQIHSHSL